MGNKFIKIIPLCTHCNGTGELKRYSYITNQIKTVICQICNGKGVFSATVIPIKDYTELTKEEAEEELKDLE